MQYAPTLTDQKLDFLLSIESKTRNVLGRMQYAPTLTNQKLNSLSSIESSARYVLGRMQYAPTLTDQKFDFLLSIESKTRYVWGCMSLQSIHSRRGTLKICMNAPKTRRGLDRYGHIHAKPAEDGTNMAIFTQNPPRIGRIWPYLCKTRRGWDEYGHSYRILAGVRIKYVSSFVIFGEDGNVCVKVFLKLGNDRKVGRQIYLIRGKKKKV